MRDSQKRANDKYLQANYETFSLHYPKGTKEKWKSFAASKGLTFASFVRLACSEYIQNHKFDLSAASAVPAVPTVPADFDIYE